MKKSNAFVFTIIGYVLLCIFLFIPICQLILAPLCFCINIFLPFYIFKKTKDKRYLVLNIFTPIILIIAMMCCSYIKRGVSARLKMATDDIGDQYTISSPRIEEKNTTR